MRIGVIGGTGVYAWGSGEELVLETEHGDVPVTYRREGRHEIVFLPRHGPHHERAPHAVPHRAHVRALAAARVEYAIGIFNVGALDPAILPGSWVVPDDLLDLAPGAESALHGPRPFHVDMTEPFCPTLRMALLAAAKGRVRDGGVYATTAGPRFETRAEARALRALGADVVGMTCGPEAALAREAGLCYGALAFVASPAAGLGAGASATELQQLLGRHVVRLRSWVARAGERLPVTKSCACQRRRVGAALGPLGAPQ
jgi:5'-methylthioadenosine phosphorylase